MPAGKGTIRDASADEKHGNLAAASLVEESGPDFGFQDDDQRGFRGVKNSPDAERPVEREIDDRVGEGHAFLDQGLPGEGGGGNDEWPLGISFCQPLGKGKAGKGFTDRNGVDPDGAGPVGGEFLEFRNGKTEALGEIGKIFAVAKALYKPIRRRQQGGKTQQKAVKEIHSI